MASRVRVFIASSLDGFIAGPNHEIDWLEGFEGAEDTFTPFMTQVGALLMGRRTYDVVEQLAGQWGYGDTPVLVGTTRPLDPVRPSVRAVGGTVDEMVAEAVRAAGDKDVYLDGGRMIRAALAANLIDELTVTMIPMILGDGIPLFAGAGRRYPLELVSARDIGGGLVQLVYTVASSGTSA